MNLQMINRRPTNYLQVNPLILIFLLVFWLEFQARSAPNSCPKLSRRVDTIPLHEVLRSNLLIIWILSLDSKFRGFDLALLLIFSLKAPCFMLTILSDTSILINPLFILFFATSLV